MKATSLRSSLNKMRLPWANTGSLPKEASADAGYFSAKAIEELCSLGVDAFIPPDKTAMG